MPPKHHLDVLGGLLALSWRGIEVPCQQIGMDGSHRLTEHNQYAAQGGYQENGGRVASSFTFRIPFRNGIVGWETLYPGTYREFLDALLDPTTGDLNHPEYGLLACKAASWSVVWDPQKRDGCDLDVTWKEHNDGSGLEDAEMFVGVVADAATFDLEARELDVGYDDGSGSSIVDVLGGLQGQLELLQLSVGDQLTKITNTINAVNDMVDALEKLTDPKAWGVADAGKKILASLNALAENVSVPGKIKKVAIKINDTRGPATQVAGKWGMSSDDFLKLNPSTAITGTVEEGEEFFVFEER